MDKAPAIGIDLGTTYSCVGVFEYGLVEIIANDQGNRTTPSYVAFTERGRLIGDAAKAQVASNHENTVYDAKRLLGKRFTDATVAEDIKHFPFQVFNQNGKPGLQVQYKNELKQFSPEEISSMVLVKMKEIAEAYLGMEVTDAVITVPAYFSDAQRKATKDAGAIAGLNVLRIINEPTAAALAYGLDKRAQGEKNVLVFDLGGGTFDVSILTIDDGVFEVKVSTGDSHLGGEDFDTRMVTYCVNEFKRKHDKDISNDKKAVRRLRTACEETKRTLSTATQASLDVPALHEGIDFSMKINRAKFEELCLDLFQSTILPVEKALLDAHLEKMEINEIILVGGSTRIPKIRKLLQDYFNGKELNTDINPDEAVAYGAAVQAAILSGSETDLIQDMVLLDVVPLSKGIETVGGVMCTIIERNSTIPCRQMHYASTDSANQTNVYVTAFEGERPLTKDNIKLGEFILDGIQPAGPGGQFPIIEIIFEIDADGIMNVSAVNSSTGAKNQMTIAHDYGRLTQVEIDRMRKQVEAFRVEDAIELARVQSRNFFHTYIEHVSSTMNEARFKEQASAIEQQQFAAKVQEAANWLSDATLAPKEEVETIFAQLKQHCQPIVQRIYNE